MAQHRKQLELQVLPQPDNSTCGPTCLHAVYRYWGEDVPLSRVISEIEPLPEGGTLAVNLACHALRRGFGAAIYTYNLQLFDPTWFADHDGLPDRLRAQAEAKDDPKLSLATEQYLEYLKLGGEVRFAELNGALLRRYLSQGIPILTGLSATYLYDCARELDDEYNDTAGQPTGHFVVLSGYDREKREVMVADPLHDNPRFGGQYYSVGTGRLIAAILLGIVTYDANLLILSPRGG